MQKCHNCQAELTCRNVIFETSILSTDVLKDLYEMEKEGPVVKCPKCGEHLTDDEIKKLWASRNGSRTSEAKRQAAIENGKKRKEKKDEYNNG